ncbi:lipoyl(octanoyl) transferase [Ruaniaceae bacterium KH17]|nr:lipoyl(octanoyl) transferase [Ruaniaceae bacterium KH17]
MKFNRLGPGFIPYPEAWELQQRIHADVVAGTQEDTVLLLQHESVYTAGRRTASWDRPTSDVPVIDVDRGGKITWHGPGQLVGYPILHLPEPLDVVEYVRRLERAIMSVCAELGLETQQVAGRSGVWVVDGKGRDRKVCAIGVRVARGVTMHGFALNCNNTLGFTQVITPCGIADADVTTLSNELGREVTVESVIEIVERQLAETFELETA